MALCPPTLFARCLLLTLLSRQTNILILNMTLLQPYGSFSTTLDLNYGAAATQSE
jgi:hypothetical protein